MVVLSVMFVRVVVVVVHVVVLRCCWRVQMGRVRRIGGSQCVVGLVVVSRLDCGWGQHVVSLGSSLGQGGVGRYLVLRCLWRHVWGIVLV